MPLLFRAHSPYTYASPYSIIPLFPYKIKKPDHPPLNFTPQQSRFLLKTSLVTSVGTLYCYYRSYTGIAIIDGIAVLTSINYWRDPRYDWRRTMDIWWIGGCLTYHLLRAYKSQYYIGYYALTCLGCSLYPFSHYYYNCGKYWNSVYLHSGLHVLANIANIILYSGYIPPIWKNPVVGFLVGVC
jgi:hypothetical protein